jgi:hypothetical protein
MVNATAAERLEERVANACQHLAARIPFDEKSHLEAAQVYGMIRQSSPPQQQDWHAVEDRVQR